MEVTYRWRGEFENAEVKRLHAEGFGHEILEDDWKGQVERHSLGWVCARDGGELIGFRERAVGRWHPRLHPRHDRQRSCAPAAYRDPDDRHCSGRVACGRMRVAPRGLR